MSVSDIPLFGMLRERMNWLQARQSVLARNVANADTPGYAAHDLKAPDFRKLVEGAASGRLQMAATREGHLRGSAGASAASRAFRDVEAPDSETTPDGNSVVLEEQMMKVAETQMDYQAATGLYAKGLGLIRLAITGRG